MKTQLNAWLLAIRPKTLSISLIPVLVGLALAHKIGATINWVIALFTFATAIFIQIGTNLINDALDFKRGADTSDRVGPSRATQSGLLTFKQTYIMGWIAFAAALLCGIPLIQIGGWITAILIIVSIASGYFYTGGPYPLAYYGLGEIFVILFFGISATAATYYLQTGLVDFKTFLAGTQIGFLASLILSLNNYRDLKSDRKVNKNTLAVLLGPFYGRLLISALGILPFSINVFWFYWHYLAAAIIPWLAVKIAIDLIVSVWKTESGEAVKPLFSEAGKLYLFFGILLTIGLWI